MHFGPRIWASDFVPALAALSRWTTIAVIDGAAPPTSINPQAAESGKRAARTALGDRRYEDEAAFGRSLSHEAFEAFLQRELDELGIEQEPRSTNRGSDAGAAS